jgi:hypothetical protein
MARLYIEDLDETFAYGFRVQVYHDRLGWSRDAVFGPGDGGSVGDGCPAADRRVSWTLYHADVG